MFNMFVIKTSWFKYCFANIYLILNRIAMEKLYAVFTDYEHDKVGIP
jgi:hypothetical protein